MGCFTLARFAACGFGTGVAVGADDSQEHIIGGGVGVGLGSGVGSEDGDGTGVVVKVGIGVAVGSGDGVGVGVGSGGCESVTSPAGAHP